MPIFNEEKFSSFLKQKGLKFTPERKVILKEVFSLNDHFDADDLYDRLRYQGEKISRATIYRTLPLLVENGLISEALRQKGKSNYELIYGHEHHDHMVCMNCGRIIEFRDDTIEALQEKICSRYNFQALNHRLGIRGYCTACTKKGKIKQKA
ncbi:MAG: transcriptional repressor [bacterium]